ncbi:reverse transcriptase domain-containing protein [Tanacetum coccineum]
MTTPRPTPFSTTGPRTRVFTPFVIISDFDNEITTLPMRPAPPSPDHTPALYVYPLDSGDDISDENLSDTTKSLHTHSTSTSVVHPSFTRSLSTSLVLASQPGKEIPMPLGYRAAMDRWRAAPSSTTFIRVTILIFYYDGAENTGNKRKWEGNHKGSSSQQQNKEPKVIRAHIDGPNNKEGDAGNLPLCNKCEFHHTGPCAAKCGKCKRFGHQTRDCRTPILSLLLLPPLSLLLREVISFWKRSKFVLQVLQIPLRIDDADFDLEGDILLLEKLLNDDPSSPLLPKELNFEELKTIKSSIDDPSELKLKDLSSHLEYAFLEETNKLPVIITKSLKDDEKVRLLKVLKSHKRAIAWKISDIKGIDPQFCTHKILMEDDFKSAVQHQRRVNPKIHEVIKKEVIKLLDAGLIYPISDSRGLVTGWRVCIDYQKLNDATRKDHFPLPFMDQMLERLAGNEYYCFLDGFSGYFQIPIDLQDQEKTTFTCPYGTFAYLRMPFGLCNASGTFQRCMMAIFHDMIEETMEVFMDNFSVFGDSF